MRDDDASYERTGPGYEQDAPPEPQRMELPKWALIAFVLFLVSLALELMLIAGLAWYRIIFGLYNTDLELFVMSLNEFGSSFFGDAILGAGGAIAAMRLIPPILSKINNSSRKNDYK